MFDQHFTKCPRRPVSCQHCKDVSQFKHNEAHEKICQMNPKTRCGIEIIGAGSPEFNGVYRRDGTSPKQCGTPKQGSRGRWSKTEGNCCIWAQSTIHFWIMGKNAQLCDGKDVERVKADWGYYYMDKDNLLYGQGHTHG